MMTSEANHIKWYEEGKRPSATSHMEPEAADRPIDSILPQCPSLMVRDRPSFLSTIKINTGQQSNECKGSMKKLLRSDQIPSVMKFSACSKRLLPWETIIAITEEVYSER